MLLSRISSLLPAEVSRGLQSLMTDIVLRIITWLQALTDFILRIKPKTVNKGATLNLNDLKKRLEKEDRERATIYMRERMYELESLQSTVSSDVKGSTAKKSSLDWGSYYLGETWKSGAVTSKSSSVDNDTAFSIKLAKGILLYVRFFISPLLDYTLVFAFFILANAAAEASMERERQTARELALLLKKLWADNTISKGPLQSAFRGLNAASKIDITSKLASAFAPLSYTRSTLIPAAISALDMSANYNKLDENTSGETATMVITNSPMVEITSDTAIPGDSKFNLGSQQLEPAGKKRGVLISQSRPTVVVEELIPGRPNSLR
jgi:hypothetical protein